MMIFTSIYVVVDGYFVSNYTEKTPFAAVNFIMPVLIILGCVGFMFGTGSSALISKTMGEGDGEKANRIFTFVVVTSVIIGTAIGVLGIIFLRPIGILLGGEGQLLDDSVTYGTIILIAQPVWLPFIVSPARYRAISGAFSAKSAVRAAVFSQSAHACAGSKRPRSSCPSSKPARSTFSPHSSGVPSGI